MKILTEILKIAAAGSLFVGLLLVSSGQPKLMYAGLVLVLLGLVVIALDMLHEKRKWEAHYRTRAAEVERDFAAVHALLDRRIGD